MSPPETRNASRPVPSTGIPALNFTGESLVTTPQTQCQLTGPNRAARRSRSARLIPPIAEVLSADPPDLGRVTGAVRVRCPHVECGRIHLCRIRPGVWSSRRTPACGHRISVVVPLVGVLLDGGAA